MSRNNPHPTLSDVARRAGVGTTTVSRVINGGERVSPETLNRVKIVIEQLGYMPNHAARILKGGQTKTIGLVMPSMADSFFASCAEAAQRVAKAHDSLLIVTASNNDPLTELENLRVLVRHRPDGLLLVPSGSNRESEVLSLLRAPVPVVCFDRPSGEGAFASVVVDNYLGAKKATQHLIEHGRRRILCLGGEPELYTIRERLRGYREAMQHAGLEPQSALSAVDHRSTEDAILRYLRSSSPPDAIFTLKNSATIFVFETLQKLNLAVPAKVALVGFDDFELAETLRPAITVVEQPVQEVGRAAAELLFGKIMHAHEDAKERSIRNGSRIVELQTRLVRRGSCGCVQEA